MAKTIKVTIDQETHEASVDLDGFHGKGCAAITEAFSAMGSTIATKNKPEFRQQVCNVVKK